MSASVQNKFVHIQYILNAYGIQMILNTYQKIQISTYGKIQVEKFKDYTYHAIQKQIICLRIKSVQNVF